MRLQQQAAACRCSHACDDLMLLAASRQRDVQEVVLDEACNANNYTRNRCHCAFRNMSTVGHKSVMGLGFMDTWIASIWVSLVSAGASS